MKRLVYLFAGLLAVFASVFALSLDYGSSQSLNFELNDSYPLSITVTGVPAHVHGLYVYLSDELDGHVYCAPGLVSHEANDTWDADFTCILLPGSYTGTIYLKPTDVDVNYEDRARTTRIDISVARKEVWYKYYGQVSIGGSLTAGQYRIEVIDADVVTAQIKIYKGASVVWGGVTFIGREIDVSDSFRVVYNGYSTKLGLAFFTIESRTPIAVTSTQQQLYLVVPQRVYLDEHNKATITVATTCSQVKLCYDNNCQEKPVPDSHTVSFDVDKAGDYKVYCVGADLSQTVSVDKPIVITKTVTKEVRQDPNQICPSWFYGLPPQRKASMCGQQYTPPSQPGTGPNWTLLGILAAIVVGFVVYKKFFGGKSKGGFEEPEKEIEAVPEMEG